MKNKPYLFFLALLFGAISLHAQAAPVDVTASTFVGHQVTFTVTADSKASDGSDVPFSIQWNKNAIAISGATASPFVLKNLQLTDTGVYTATLTNAFGSVVSPKATITVTTAPIAPVITSQPVSLSALVGTKPSFSVVATGTGPLTYQWKKDGVNYPASNPTSMTATLVNPSADAGDAGTYTCVVTGPGGSVTSAPAILVIITVTLPKVTSLSAVAL